MDGISQINSTSRLIEIGDSILVSTIGLKYVDYYSLDTNSFYEIDRLFRKGIKKPLTPNEIIKGKFQLASVKYSIKYPEIIELSSTLAMIINSVDSIKVYTTDIPNFILGNRESNFLPRETLIKISDSLLTKNGVKTNYYLERDYQNKEFIWKTDNIIIECTEGKFMDGEMEILRINPYTGDILEHRITGYGYVY
jgi:hypothetical protein